MTNGNKKYIFNYLTFISTNENDESNESKIKK